MKKSVGVFSTYEQVIGGSWCVTGAESHLSHLKFHEDHFTMAPKKHVGIAAECTVSLHFFAPQEQGESDNPQSDEHPEAFQFDCSVEGAEDHPS